MIKTAFYSTSTALNEIRKISAIWKLGKSGEISYSPSM